MSRFSSNDHNKENNKSNNDSTSTSTTSSRSSAISSSNNTPPNNHHHKLAAATGAGAWGGISAHSTANGGGLEEHILTKERTLDWFLSTPAEDQEGDEEDGSMTDGSSENEDVEGEEDQQQPLPSLASLSIHGSDAACTTSSSALSSEEADQLGVAPWTEEERQRQQQEEAAMVREYSFRDIFEYLGGRTQSASFCRPSSRTSSAHNLAAAGAASPARKNVDTRPFSERMAAKCRAAPEYSSSYSSYASPSASWLLPHKHKVGGYVGKAAATLGLGTVVSTTTTPAAASTHAHTHNTSTLAPSNNYTSSSSNSRGPAAAVEESGWDWYLELDVQI